VRKTLLLFTGSYPFAAAAENTFLPQEIAVLRTRFDALILVPTSTSGGRVAMGSPDVPVDVTYAAFIASWPRRLTFALLALVDPAFWTEVIGNASILLRHPRALPRVLHHHAVARMTQRWIGRLRPSVPWSDVLLYTWWFDGTTLGLARFARRLNVPVITRAHGYDLYEGRHQPPYIPFRRQALETVSAVFSASRAGATYLTDRYPGSRDRTHAALLGVDDPGFANAPSADGVFRIVSCSFLVPVKRIDLLIRGLAETGKLNSRQAFEWTHVGDGPERESLATLARASLPKNVAHHIVPYPGREGLLEFYRRQPVDLFINTSSSEGTPVSIMEAISAGIPIMATSVGGNVEIVGPENGVLIGADPTPEEIARAINALVGEPAALARLRTGSRGKWEREYSAGRNYAEFAETIRGL
jgi:glycosyltransferase involved in cell wall biosynthesis